MWHGHRELVEQDKGHSWSDGPLSDGRTDAQRVAYSAQMEAFLPWREDILALFQQLEDWARWDGYAPRTVLPFGAEIYTIREAEAARTAALDRLQHRSRVSGEALLEARQEVQERLEKEARDREINRQWREKWEREERERRAALDAPSPLSSSRAFSSSRASRAPTAVFTSARGPLLRVTPDEAPAEAAPAPCEEAPRPWHEERAEQLAQAASLGHLLEVHDMSCGFRGKLHALQCEGKDEIFRCVSRASDFEDILRGAIRRLEAPAPAPPAPAAPAPPALAAPADMSALMARFGRKR
jgi:hypothetical protein